MGWTAVYLPAKSDGSDPTKMGFASEKEAWDYIGERLCKLCKADLASDDDDYEEPVDTPCGAEWVVITDEDFCEAEDFPDLLEAAGYKRIWTKEDGWVDEDAQRRFNGETE